MMSLLSLLASGLLAGTLAPGPHAVGFRLLDGRDSSRKLDGQARPVQIALWYPARQGSDPALTYGDYVGLAASERTLGWPAPEAAAREREGYREFLTSNGVPAEAVATWLARGMRARREDAPESGRFPLVLIAQGNGHSAHHQAVLAEHLASHGFVVATSPSQVRLGDGMESENDVPASARQQARDLALVATEVRKQPFVAAGPIAFVAHSFGARSALLAALDEPGTAALVSLDGGIGSATAADWLDSDTTRRLPGACFPVLHVYEEQDAFMAPSFTTLEAMTTSDRYLVRVDGLHHRQFTSLGWAAATIPGLDEADSRTGLRCDAVARLVQRFLATTVGGQPTVDGARLALGPAEQQAGFALRRLSAEPPRSAEPSLSAEPSRTSTPLETLAQVERDFAKMSVAEGVRASFYANFADDGINFTPHPVKTREAIAKLPPASAKPTTTLDWYPTFSDVSAAGDLGFNTGPWIRTTHDGSQPPAHGYFFSVWKQQADGTWKVVLDVGIDVKEPLSTEVASAWRGARHDSYQVKGAVDVGAEGEALKRAESALRDAVAAKGLSAAYSAALAQDFRVYRNDLHPFVTADTLAANLNEEGTRGVLSWEPTHVEVSGSADSGYTWGSYSRTPSAATTPAENGYYAHVWRRDSQGDWRLAIEVMRPLPPPPN